MILMLKEHYKLDRKQIFNRWMWFEDGRKYWNACLHRPIYILIDKLWSKVFIHIDLLHSICVHIHWINSLCFFIIRIHGEREEKKNIKKSLFKGKKIPFMSLSTIPIQISTNKYQDEIYIYAIRSINTVALFIT